MSASFRERMEKLNRCRDCGDDRDGSGVRCSICAEKHRERNRQGYQKKGRTHTPKGREQLRDLAELQAIKRGEPVPPDDGIPPLPLPSKPAITPRARQFIQAQDDEAAPLLARLYQIPISEVLSLRAMSARRERGLRMPLRLLQELADQREERFKAEDFTDSRSSIAACAENA